MYIYVYIYISYILHIHYIYYTLHIYIITYMYNIYIYIYIYIYIIGEITTHKFTKILFRCRSRMVAIFSQNSYYETYKKDLSNNIYYDFKQFIKGYSLISQKYNNSLKQYVTIS